MALTRDVEVLLIASEAGAGCGARVAAERYGWSVIESPDPGKMLDQLRLSQAKVVVVEIADDWDSNFDLLPLLHEYPRRLTVVGLAVSEDEQLEMAVRAEGIDCFVPYKASTALVIDYVERLSVEAEAGAAASASWSQVN